MRNKYKLMSILAITLMLSSLCGCGNNQGDEVKDSSTIQSKVESDVTSVSENSESQAEISDVESIDLENSTDNAEGNTLKLDDVETKAYDFAVAIQTKNIEKLRSCLPYEDTTFISDSDIEWLFLRSEYADVFGKSSPIIDFNTTDEDYENKRVSFDAEDGSYIMVDLILKDDNKWYINMDTSYFVEDYSIKLPYGPATYNGITIDEKYIGTEENVAYADYILPVIISKPAEVTVDFGGTIGVQTKKIEEGVSGRQDFPYTLNDEDSGKLVVALQTQINEIFSAYLDHCYKDTDFAVVDYCSSCITEKGLSDIESQIKGIKRSPYSGQSNAVGQNDTITITSLSDKWNDGSDVVPFSLYGKTKEGELIYIAYFNVNRHSDMYLRSGANMSENADGVLWAIFTIEDNKVKMYETPDKGIFNTFS